jgi:hypothetical protein
LEETDIVAVSSLRTVSSVNDALSVCGTTSTQSLSASVEFAE